MCARIAIRQHISNHILFIQNSFYDYGAHKCYITGVMAFFLFALLTTKCESCMARCRHQKSWICTGNKKHKQSHFVSISSNHHTKFTQDNGEWIKQQTIRNERIVYFQAFCCCCVSRSNETNIGSCSTVRMKASIDYPMMIWVLVLEPKLQQNEKQLSVKREYLTWNKRLIRMDCIKNAYGHDEW